MHIPGCGRTLEEWYREQAGGQGTITTMRITFEIPPELEGRLRERARAKDAGSLRQLLAEAVAPVVEALLREPERADVEVDQLTMEEFDALCEELDRMEAIPSLPGEAITREGIYQDHP